MLLCGEVAVVVAPDVFGEVEWQAFSADASFAGELSFKASPESFKSVNVCAGFAAVFSFAVVL